MIFTFHVIAYMRTPNTSEVEKYVLRIENQLIDDELIQTIVTPKGSYLIENLQPDTDYIVQINSMADADRNNEIFNRDIQQAIFETPQLNFCFDSLN